MKSLVWRTFRIAFWTLEWYLVSEMSIIIFVFGELYICLCLTSFFVKTKPQSWNESKFINFSDFSNKIQKFQKARKYFVFFLKKIKNEFNILNFPTKIKNFERKLLHVHDSKLLNSGFRISFWAFVNNFMLLRLW